MKVCGNLSKGTSNLAREFTKRCACTFLETRISQTRELKSMVPLKTRGYYPLAEAQQSLGQEGKLWTDTSQDELVGTKTLKNERKLNVV